MQDSTTCPSATKNSLQEYETDLERKWGITEPTFAYNSLEFALCYGVSDMISDSMAQHVVYQNDCLTPATSNALDVSHAMSGVPHDPSGGFADRTQKLNLEINPETIATSNIFYQEPNGDAKGKQDSVWNEMDVTNSCSIVLTIRFCMFCHSRVLCPKPALPSRWKRRSKLFGNDCNSHCRFDQLF